MVATEVARLIELRAERCLTSRELLGSARERLRPHARSNLVNSETFATDINDIETEANLRSYVL